ncbi:uncharacterized protein LOC128126925 [Lactuca sativa]|nr:uncharacterized protein LOC128126925 [Lactuca sativa]
MQRGHNKLCCKNASINPTPKPKKKIGRPRLNLELTNCTRGGRGSKRGSRGSGRRSTSVYEKCESFGISKKKEHGIERQFITQTTPDVESEFVPQKNIKIDVEETQEENDEDGVKDDEQHLLLIVNIFQKNIEVDVEGDGLDMTDMDQILHELSYLRESKDNEAEILLCINITQSQLKEFDALLHQSKKVTKEDNDENKEESNYEDGVKETQEDNDEDGAEDDEEGVDDTQVRVRSRKPSERIIENMLKKIMVDKKGIGMALEKPLTLD